MNVKVIPAILAALLLFSGCAASIRPGTAENEVLTMTPVPSDKLLITISQDENTKSGRLETAIEENFPGVDVVMLSNVTANSNARTAPRLEHRDLPDIVLSDRPESGSDYQPGALMDLSGKAVSGNYYISSLNSTQTGGRLYFLPGPSEIYGIVYNKTMFEEHGWALPHDFDSFVALCRTVQESGIHSLKVPLDSQQSLRNLLCGFSYQEVFNGPENADWLVQYKNGVGTMAGHMEPLFQVFQSFLDAGVIHRTDFDVTKQQRNEMMFRDRRCAMIIDSTKSMDYAKRYGSQDTFAIMPFYGLGEDADFVLTQPIFQLAVNKTLEQPENKDKYERVMQILDFISSPEGQRSIMGDEPAMIGTVRGLLPEKTSFLESVYPTLLKGNIARLDPLLQRAPYDREAITRPLYEGLRQLSAGLSSPAQIMQDCDYNRLSVPSANNARIIGTVAEDFTLLETACYMADVIRDAAGADIALHMAGLPDLGVNRKFYAGPVSSELLSTMVPIQQPPEGKETLLIAELTGTQLRQLLDDPPSDMDINTGIQAGYYAVSGMKVEFAPWAPKGSRILKLQNLDGSPLEESKTYRVAFYNGAVKAEYLASARDTGPASFSELLSSAIRRAGTITPPKDGRMKLNWNVTSVK